MVIYSVIFFDHDASSDEEPLLVGVYTTFTAALDTARGARTHEDDSWVIKKHLLNTIDPGEAIWDAHTDEHRDLERLYARHFPGGFPALPK